MWEVKQFASRLIICCDIHVTRGTNETLWDNPGWLRTNLYSYRVRFIIELSTAVLKKAFKLALNGLHANSPRIYWQRKLIEAKWARKNWSRIKFMNRNLLSYSFGYRDRLCNWRLLFLHTREWEEKFTRRERRLIVYQRSALRFEMKTFQNCSSRAPLNYIQMMSCSSQVPHSRRNIQNNRYFYGIYWLSGRNRTEWWKENAEEKEREKTTTTVKNILPINNKFLFYFFSIYNLEMEKNIHFIRLFFRYGLLRLVFVNPSCGTHSISCCFIYRLSR